MAPQNDLKFYEIELKRDIKEIIIDMLSEKLNNDIYK